MSKTKLTRKQAITECDKKAADQSSQFYVIQMINCGKHTENKVVSFDKLCELQQTSMFDVTYANYGG